MFEVLTSHGYTCLVWRQSTWRKFSLYALSTYSKFCASGFMMIDFHDDYSYTVQKLSHNNCAIYFCLHLTLRFETPRIERTTHLKLSHHSTKSFHSELRFDDGWRCDRLQFARPLWKYIFTNTYANLSPFK